MIEEKTLGIVIPVYNGQATIADVVNQLDREDISSLKEVVLVVDGSPDSSLEVCLSLTPSNFCLSVIELARNFGEYNAVMAGLSQISTDFVITMDDDLQNPPSEVRKLFEHALNHSVDVVYAQYDRKAHSVWRNLGSRFTNWCVEKTIGKPRDLYLASFRCISRMVVDEICRYTGPFPYTDGLILQTTRHIGAVTVKHLPRARGGSNYTLRKLLSVFSAMFFNFSIQPLRIGAVLGGALSLLGLIGFIVVVFEALLTSTPPGWATVAAAVFLLAGVQLLVLWLVGEYLGRVYLTMNKKPQYVIRSISTTSSKPTHL